eukprot:Skav218616  [mRNA]  locus=scaffold3208:127808:128248:- [translate_table: standard]
MPETWKRPRNTIHSNDFGFFKEINDVIQREPIDFLDPELRGNLSAIGIKKGEAFNPDERMKAILTEGASCLKECDTNQYDAKAFDLTHLEPLAVRFSFEKCSMQIHCKGPPEQSHVLHPSGSAKFVPLGSSWQRHSSSIVLRATSP